MCAKDTLHRALAAPGELFFSSSELRKLVEQENSCVSVVTTKRSISLMPLHLRNLKASIKELLNAKVNRYDVQLEGVILAHKNVKLMVNSTLLSDSRYFHLEYLADIYVFKPKVGNSLTGVVNKITVQYVNILVHGVFNVTVYCSGSQEFEGLLRIGCQVVVKVTALDYTGRLPFIKASIISSIDEESVDVTPADSKKRKKKKSREREEDEQTSLIGISQREEQSSVIGVSQRNKELVSILKNSPLRIARNSSFELESQDAESSSTESSKARATADTPTTVRAVTETARKKKKKKKSKSDEVDEKPSKKRKREGEEEVTDSVSPKKKKKKTKHKDKEIGEIDQHAAIAPRTNQETAALLDNTVQIQADESIYKAASSTPLGPPPPPQKRKRETSEKREQSALVDSLLQLKMEEMSSVHSSLDPSRTKRESKSKKRKIKREAGENHSSRDDSSSVDADDPPKKKKKKKKDKDSAIDELSKSMLSQALKSMKEEA